ncbi:pyridoxamine 5'-phosphate oxidase family protein [Nocardioides sp. GXQ0305]|uniref:pyridoxamine 5'-phosphate oxidase family protein n=1 Tax=Nocardioides sp. GXQ0305 TaxID=3423912 RepID=UPI003D7ED8B6
MPESHELGYSVCEALLRAGVVGRVGFTSPAGPEVAPVNYSVVDTTVVLRTSADSALATYGVDAVVAFETDHVDFTSHRGWSVVARGRAALVHDPKELDRIRHEWEPRPWASGPRETTLRIRWDELTGRKLGEGWDPLLDLPQRRVVQARGR